MHNDARTLDPCVDQLSPLARPELRKRNLVCFPDRAVLRDQRLGPWFTIDTTTSDTGFYTSVSPQASNCFSVGRWPSTSYKSPGGIHVGDGGGCFSSQWPEVPARGGARRRAGARPLSVSPGETWADCVYTECAAACSPTFCNVRGWCQLPLAGVGAS